MRQGLAIHKAELLEGLTCNPHYILCAQTVGKPAQWLVPVLDGENKNADDNWSNVTCGNCEKIRRGGKHG